MSELTIEEFNTFLQKYTITSSIKLYDFINNCIPRHSVYELKGQYYGGCISSCGSQSGGIQAYINQMSYDKYVIDQELIESILNLYQSFIHNEIKNDNISQKIDKEYTKIDDNIIKIQENIINEKQRLEKLTNDIIQQNEELKKKIIEESSLMDSFISQTKILQEKYVISDVKSKEEQLENMINESKMIKQEIEQINAENDILAKTKINKNLSEKVTEKMKELKILQNEKEKLTSEYNILCSRNNDKQLKIKKSKEELYNKKQMIDELVKNIQDNIQKIKNINIDEY